MKNSENKHITKKKAKPVNNPYADLKIVYQDSISRDASIRFHGRKQEKEA